MHYTETAVQGRAKSIGDGIESATVVRLHRGDTAYQPGSAEPIAGPATVVYAFNPAGTRVDILDAWPLPVWLLRIVKWLRWHL